jgi:hypothetical protein
VETEMKSRFKFGRVVMRKVKVRDISINCLIPTFQPAWFNGRRLNDFYFCKFDGIRFLAEEQLQKLIYRAKHRRLYLTYKNEIKINLKEK